MHLGRVIGSIWATRKHAALDGASLRLVQPLDDDRSEVGDPLAVLDTLGSGPGELVMYVTAYEAVIPWKELHPHVDVAGVDAAVVGIVDRVDVARTAEGEA
ncbi:MAG: ethanolamine utilization protein EutN [Planctomycetes bacterium]|nr:ethanolamine utilization protein EutN [Planctomycetota bacterium]